MAQDETLLEKRTLLRQRLGPLSKEELRDLCFDPGVKHDDLGGEGAAAKARELVDYLERQCRKPDLEHYLTHPPGVLQHLRWWPVKQMLARSVHKRLAAASQADRELHQPQIDATNGEIDKLVYELPRGADGRGNWGD